MQENRGIPLSNVDSLLLSDESYSADTNVFKNTILADMSGDGEKNSSMDQWPEYHIDAPFESNYHRIST